MVIMIVHIKVKGFEEKDIVHYNCNKILKIKELDRIKEVMKISRIFVNYKIKI